PAARGAAQVGAGHRVHLGEHAPPRDGGGDRRVARPDGEGRVLHVTAVARWSPIERCRGCHAASASLAEVLRMDPMPLAGQFCVTGDEARTAARYPLTWVQCASCSLTQVLEDVDDGAMFGQYNYASSS